MDHGEWIKEIDLAEQELEKFLRQGRSVVRRFMDERDSADAMARKFNIFAANVGIMEAALYSKLPKASVSRRFGQSNDEPARVAALMIQNAVMQDMQEPRCDFDQTMRESIQDWLVPGLGQAWVRLESETENLTSAQVTAPDGTVLVEAFQYEQITKQRVIIEHVFWEDFLVSPCRTYRERRWIGRRVYMTKDQLTKRFGKAKAERCSLDYRPNKHTEDNTPKHLAKNQAIVYELWDRTKKEVVWICKGFDDFLDKKADPLKLEGFDPCPRPLFAQQSTSNVIPKSDFVMLQDQYDELDTVNHRISLLVQACRVAGVYDQANKGVQQLLQTTADNILIPVDNWAMFAEKGGMKGVIDWMPLEQVVGALDRLRQSREDIKGQIYELTGISDIVRGASKASETLGAQQLKAQFANIRVQNRQDDVARFAQEILQLKAEIMCRHFTPEMLIKMSNFQYYYDFGNRQLIEEAIQLIKGDHEEFEWRVNVQADSLAQLDYAQQRQEKVEFTNAVATYLQSTASVLKGAPEFAPIVLETLKFVVSGFRGSQELEGIVDQTLAKVQQQLAAPKPPPPPPPEVIKAQADIQMKEKEFQLKAQGKQVEMQQNSQAKQQELQFKAVEHQQEMQQSAQDHEQKMQQADQKATFDMMNKIAQAAQKATEEKPND